MPNFSDKAEVTVTVSPFDMGLKFASMDAADQARFFSGVAAAIENWPRPACFQWQMMRDAMDAMPHQDALMAFRDMAEYGQA